MWFENYSISRRKFTPHEIIEEQPADGIITSPTHTLSTPKYQPAIKIYGCTIQKALKVTEAINPGGFLPSGRHKPRRVAIK